MKVVIFLCSCVIVISQLSCSTTLRVAVPHNQSQSWNSRCCFRCFVMPGILHGRSIAVVTALWIFTLILVVRGTRTEGSGLIDWARLWVLFTRVNPYFFSAIGIAAAVGLSVAG